MALIDFDVDSVPASEHDVIPSGLYEAVITNSESRPTRAGNGRGYNFEFEIISGEMKGRKFFEWINFELSTSPVAQEIGHKKLRNLCRALGVTKLKDTADLHNIPLMVSLGIDRRDSTRNEVRAFKSKPMDNAARTVQSTEAAPWARA